MDIIIYIILIVIIGLFFVLDKFSNTNNAMFVVVILSLIGFIFILNNPTIDLVDYTKVEKINSSFIQYPQTDITSYGLGLFDMQTFLVMVFTMFLFISGLNILTGKDKINGDN